MAKPKQNTKPKTDDPASWSTTRRILDTLGRDLIAAALVIDEAGKRLEDQLPGTPGSGFGGNGGGTATSSAVERALGLAGDEDPEEVPEGWDLRPDAAGARLVELRSLRGKFMRAAQDAARLRQLAEANAPHAPTRKQQNEVAALNDPAPECAHMRRMVDAFEPAHRTTDFRGILPEPLPTPLPFCRWVYDFTRAAGRLPNRKEATAHREGRQVRLHGSSGRRTGVR